MSALCIELHTQSCVTRIGIELCDEAVPFRPNVRQSQHGILAELALDRQIEMFRIGQLVVNVVARKEVHGLVHREVQCLVRWIAGNWRGERETLSEGGSGRANAERLVKHHRYRRGPVETKRSVSNFIEQVQVFDRSVVEAVSSTDAGFARPAKKLAQNPVRKAWRIRQAQSWTEVVIFGRS